MRFNVDLLPGEWLSFEAIAERYAYRFPDDKELTARGLLSPSTSSKNWIIRAVFAREESNSPLADLLFVSSDNDRKNYLQRFEHYLQSQQSFFYFRRDMAPENQNRWQVLGEGRVYAMLDPASPMAQSLLNGRGYTLSLMRSDEDDEYWQLFNRQSQPCFEHSRRLQFIVVITTPLLPQPVGVMPGTQVGRRVKKRMWSRASHADFHAAVKARYGACVITGTLLTEEHTWPWVEACHIDNSENEEGFLADNSADNGLFLRSDLQRLFSSRRLFIDGETGQVHLRHVLPEDHTLLPFYQPLEGKTCALWSLVPAATRERLSRK